MAKWNCSCGKVKTDDVAVIDKHLRDLYRARMRAKRLGEPWTEPEHYASAPGLLPGRVTNVN